VSAVASTVERYLTQYRAFAGNGARGAPAWLRELRDGAIARFGELGFPTTKQEEWRFTSVAPIAGTPFTLAPAPDSRLPTPADLAPFLLGDAALVFVNGRYSAALSRASGRPAGRVESLATALGREPGLLERHVGRYAEFRDHPFAALNTAFIADGAFVHVPARVTREQPVQLLFLSVPGPLPLVSHPRNLIVVEREARAVIVETYAALADGGGGGSEGQAYWTNAVTEIVVADGARVDHHRLQLESARAYHVATTQAHQGRDTTVNLHAVAFGGALARHDLRGTLAGPGGRLILNGLYLLEGAQHVDHHTVIDHAQPHCESHEYFNGVLDGRSHGVFNGRIIVRPGAQRTDSKQTNHNVLVSPHAQADSQPQLEIHADDVKCTHGSTVGPLDERAVHYLRSRGLDAEGARRLLTYGFAAEILGRMDVAPLRERLDGLVRARLGVR
jgi:Fe-S cluster assembly protein SufD